MNTPAIHISTDDHAKLRLLVSSLSTTSSPAIEKLRQELNRAVVLDAAALPKDIVTLNSHVEFEDVATGEVEAYTLTMPERADVEQKRLSILAPIGTALIGFRQGDEVNWSTPGGVRQLKIRQVTQPDPNFDDDASNPAIAWSRGGSGKNNAGAESPG
jgi:regulator of nucleoside diphosphate kinase